MRVLLFNYKQFNLSAQILLIKRLKKKKKDSLNKCLCKWSIQSQYTPYIAVNVLCCHSKRKLLIDNSKFLAREFYQFFLPYINSLDTFWYVTLS